MGGPDMGGLILYGACNGGPGIVRNVPNPAPLTSVQGKNFRVGLSCKNVLIGLTLSREVSREK